MADNSPIEWTDATWNPVTGCDKVSPGCDHCYAERVSERFRGTPGHPFENGFDLTLRPERMDQPSKWRRPRMIFVNSMSDLFHKEIPGAFLDAVFDEMLREDRHVYQVLTKRSSLMRDHVNRSPRWRDGREVPPHIWLGVSIENADNLVRLRHLKETRAATRFVSFEPLIGPVGEVDLSGVSWVVAGGESGPGHRPIEPEWVLEIRDQCVEQGVAFFFKQWGGPRPKSNGNLLEGREWREWPDVPRGRSGELPF